MISGTILAYSSNKPEIDPIAENGLLLANIGFSAITSFISSCLFMITSPMAIITFWIDFLTEPNHSSSESDDSLSPSPRARPRSANSQSAYQGGVIENRACCLFRKSIYKEPQNYNENKKIEDEMLFRDANLIPVVTPEEKSPYLSTSEKTEKIHREKRKNRAQ